MLIMEMVAKEEHWFSQKKKVHQANSTITLNISASGESWVWKYGKKEHDNERLRNSKKNISLPELWCILQSLNEHCSLSMSKVIQMLEGDIHITTLSFQMASICSSMALANCFGGSNDRSDKYWNCQNFQLRQYILCWVVIYPMKP